MKFSSTASIAGREGVRERHRRARAAAPSLSTRYPRLNSLQLDFAFRDDTAFLPSPLVTVFHPPASAYFCFACPYSDCDGEFDLASAVDLAVKSTQVMSTGQLRCAGTRHRGVGCTLCLDYSISKGQPGISTEQPGR